jgi:hypothetical protein
VHVLDCLEWQVYFPTLIVSGRDLLQGLKKNIVTIQEKIIRLVPPQPPCGLPFLLSIYPYFFLCDYQTAHKQPMFLSAV